jgi:hypothetical protein
MRAVLWLALSLASPVSGQTLQGHLLEMETENPISGGSVTLIDEEGESVALAVSDSSGLFLLRAPSPGRYSVSAEALGYFSTSDGPLDFTSGQELQALFHLQPNPLVLDSLHVSAEPRNRWLELSGFFYRKEHSGGFFVEREEIEERDPRNLTDLLRVGSGFRVVSSGGAGSSFGNTVVSRRFVSFQQPSGLCVPAFYLDGFRVGTPGREVLDDIADPEDVEAIEAYAGVTQIPSQWRDSHSACGVVVIWTRRGGGR